METIYGVQADTETLREAHEHHKRMLRQRQLEHRQPTTVSDSSSMTMLAASGKPRDLSKPTLITRSTSASALPPANLQGDRTDQASFASLKSNQASNNNAYLVSATLPSTASGLPVNGPRTMPSSPFISATADHSHTAQQSQTQLRSATHSPAFMGKIYDHEHPPHRLTGGTLTSIPWLSLPGAATGGNAGSGTPNHAGVESPANMFSRRRSDATSGTSTPVPHSGGSIDGLHAESAASSTSSQQENPMPHPPQLQPHNHPAHHHHLLSHQELAALSRNGSPMPLKEALPPYLRKEAGGLTSMERSLSSPGSSLVHTSPVSPFMLPLPQHSALVSSAGSHGATGGTSTSSAGGASPSHLLFPFSNMSHSDSNTVGINTTTTGSTGPLVSSARPRLEMERARSTGVLPMNHHHHHHQQQQPSTRTGPMGVGIGITIGKDRLQQHSGGNLNSPGSSTGASGAVSSSVSNLGSAGGVSGAGSFFRTSTPLAAAAVAAAIPSHFGASGGFGSSHTGVGGGASPAKLSHPSFGPDGTFPSKEVHA
ncbi:hypothetical protein BGW38_006277 [Lunasporangiospora selenospora]|uniref:Uncharacterized protein n=1 Tax=Lunasporangiospora selenospora TaxID=979761 RepID=A0A9P6KIL3_9FUNG|nr:hypothetical protein BGW38_006277 [Lunasporangiospora selenospora]